MKQPFPLKNLVSFSKQCFPRYTSYLSRYKNIDHYIWNVHAVLVKDGYFDWYNRHTSDISSDALAQEIAQLLLQKMEDYFTDYNQFKPSVIIREVQPNQIWKCGYYTFDNVIDFRKKRTSFEYDIDVAIIAYIVSFLRLTSLDDLAWDSWD